MIKELVPGVHWALLDFPSTGIVPALLDVETPHVLCWGGHVGSWRWEKFLVPVSAPLQPEPVLARAVEVDFVVETARFVELLPALGPGVSAVQLNELPPDHLDLRKVRGNELWRLLGEIGWHVWFEIPGNDFGQVASPDRSVVARAVQLAEDGH